MMPFLQKDAGLGAHRYCQLTATKYRKLEDSLSSVILGKFYLPWHLTSYWEWQVIKLLGEEEEVESLNAALLTNGTEFSSGVEKQRSRFSPQGEMLTPCLSMSKLVLKHSLRGFPAQWHSRLVYEKYTDH